jgi:hypothetical protein
MTESSFQLFQSCPRPVARTLLGHTPNRAPGGTLSPMIQFDQLLIAAIMCLVAVRLLTAA